MIECTEDEYDALARQLHESIAEGQSVALTAKALRLLAAPPAPLPLDAIQMPVQLVRSEWPPNPDLRPGGSDRFDAVYDSLRRGEPVREPITLRADLSVIDGMHRLTAARLLGLATIPVRVWTGHEWVPARLATPEPTEP